MADEIIRAAPHGIALLALDGLVVETNPAIERLLGYDRSDLVGKPCEPFTHPDDHATELPLLDAVLRGVSDGYTIEKRYLRRSGAPVWARLNLRLIRDEHGEPLRLLAMIEDVSERRRLDEEQRRLTEQLIEHRDSLQQALTAAEQTDEQMQTILECITDGFVALDSDWCYTFVNTKAGELFGRTPGDLVGKNIWEEFPEGVGQPFHRAYQKAMVDKATISLEAYYEPWDRWFENRIYGSATGIAIYFTEITDRKRIEAVEQRQRERAEALRAANEALTRTLDLEQVLGVLLDSLTSFVSYTSASILLGNATQLTLGAQRGHPRLDPDELEQRLAALTRHPLVQRVLDHGQPAAVADTTHDPDHQLLPAPDQTRSWIAVPLRAGGHLIGLGLLESDQPHAFSAEDLDWAETLTGQAATAIDNARLHDQLQRHASELEQRVAERTEHLHVAVEEAERANRAKSEFLTGISHELRTPMNAILGFAQLLELDELGGDQGESVKQILRAGRHLLELITELLDIARIEAGELALSLEPVHLDDLVAEVVDLTRPLAEQLDVAVAVEGTVGGYVLADRQRLRQVLLNLLTNAVKYNRPRGRIRVASTAPTDGRVAIAVSDTGRGIAPDDLERIFVPFERLGLEAGSVEGAGLGLALAQRLVDAMGGTVAVESVVGEGSTFTVDLPRADDPLAALTTPSEASTRHVDRVATIVYIEDNSANRRLVERALARRPGLTLLEAPDGREGLELARRHRPDLVLLDLHLPDISGEEVLDELAASPETAGVPVIVISAAASKGRVQELRRRGARSYLTKPIDIGELLAAVDSAVGERG
jgi:PAS domain S-box-containing protein